MRSIRHTIPSGRAVNTPFSRYITGSSSVVGTPPPPALSAPWKAKENATEPEPESHEGASCHEGSSECNVDSGCRISEFEAITRLYDDHNHPPPEKERVEPPRPLLNHQTTRVRRPLAVQFKEQELSSKTLLRLPPLPPRNEGRRNERNVFRSLGAKVVCAPIPLSFGTGAVEERVQRYQRMIKQREQSSQAVVDALKRPKDMLRQESSDAKNGDGVVTNRATAPLGQGTPSRSIRKHYTGRLCTPAGVSRSYSMSPYASRTYSTSAYRSRTPSKSADVDESTGPQELPVKEDTSASDSSNQAGTDSCGEIDNVAIPDSGVSKQTQSHCNGEFSKGWAGENWKEDWGADQLAPARNGQHHPSSISTPQPSKARMFSKVTTLESRHRNLRITTWRSSLGSYKSPLTRPPLTRPPLTRPPLTRPPMTRRERMPLKLIQALPPEFMNRPMPPHLALANKDQLYSSQPKIEDGDGTETALDANPTNPTDLVDRLRAMVDSHRPPTAPKPPSQRILAEVLPPMKKELDKESESVPKASKVETNIPPLSNNAQKIQELALKKMAKEGFRASVTAITGGKRKEEKAKRRQKKAQARGAAVKGVLKPLPPNTAVLEDLNKPSSIPRLAHGLDRVLFNPSVHWVQDPHSRVYNFPPTLQSLPAVTEFAFERLAEFTSSSRDEHSKPFAGSTSSLTRFLSHIYFLVSGDRPVDTSTLSMAFKRELRTFTPGMRHPAKVIFHHRLHKVNENSQPISTSAGDGQEHSSSGLDPLSSSSASSLERKAPGRLQRTLSVPTESEPESIPRSTHGASNPAEEAGSMTVLNGLATRSLDAPLADDAAVTDLNVKPNNPSKVSRSSSDRSALQLDSSQNSEGPNSHVLSKNSSKSCKNYETYAIDNEQADPEVNPLDGLNVLQFLGTMAEKFLTLSESAFTALLRKNPPKESMAGRESYRYAKSSHFVMRSQLDCQDTRLPGTGVFDIKTRAVLPIRLDQFNYQENAGYQIRTMTGLYESFEREYYDLIRSAFLKYNFQARIGNMDGVFVAYHNTMRMFGFQYVPITEMEERLYGHGPPGRGAKIFEKCIGLLEALCKEVVACYPGESVSCTIEAREGAGNLKLWVLPTSRLGRQRITELTLTIYHELNGHPANSTTVIDRANEDWDLHYNISRTSKPASRILEAYNKVRSREFVTFLPSGISKDEMMERLALVDFAAGKGFNSEPSESTEEKGTSESKGNVKFAKASGRVNFLRNLAKRGWAYAKEQDELAGDHVIFGVHGNGNEGVGKDSARPSKFGSDYTGNADVDSRDEGSSDAAAFKTDNVSKHKGNGAEHIE